MYIEPYAKDIWHDDRLFHIPTKIKQLQDIADELQWNGKDASLQLKEIAHIKAYMEESGQEFYPLF